MWQCIWRACSSHILHIHFGTWRESLAYKLDHIYVWVWSSGYMGPSMHLNGTKAQSHRLLPETHTSCLREDIQILDAFPNVDIQSPPSTKTSWNPISEQQKNIMTSRRCQKLKRVLRGSLNFWQFDNPRGLRFTSGFRSSCCFCCSRKSCFMFAALPFLS